MSYWGLEVTVTRWIALALTLLVMACSGDDKVPAQEDTVDTGPPAVVDADGDGFTSEEDCDDHDPQVNGSALEICDGIDNDCDELIDEGVQNTYYTDLDDDGFGDGSSVQEGCSAPEGAVSVANDCDDNDASAHPGGIEACDLVDNDCDGETDEGATSTWYADTDGDGFGDADLSEEACEASAGFVADDTDCDDTEASAYPDAPELCDGVDNDCDGTYDEDGSFDVYTWYEDRDEDGFGDPSRTVEACEVPEGYAAEGTDCDDLAAETFPGADELCDSADNDCDGETDEDATDAVDWYLDADGDGFGEAGSALSACDLPSGYAAADTDCDDADATVYPGAAETCDGQDEDCDGATDEGATDASVWYADSDGDGYGDPDTTEESCEAPTGYLSDSADCDDRDAAIHPAADEVCDGTDNDCDGSTDEDAAIDAATWYEDRDEDGYGDPTRSTVACEAPTDSLADSSDCDDLDADTHPSADELCDGADNDCDGSADEDATDASTWFADSDADGFGDPGDPSVACDAPAGTVSDDSDCDDSDASVHPGATETCDGEDEDCDGSIDEDSASDASTWYADSDGDGFGDPSRTKVSCSVPAGYLSDSTDCDDGDASVNPDADEICDEQDNDCDGSTDESSAVDASTWYQDRDDDGYGDAARTRVACEAPSGYLADSSDCDDLDDASYPGATEFCDDADNDCDGEADEDASDASTWYADSDGDSYGDAASTQASCDRPTGYLSDDSDCDDTDAGVFPGATEICDGEDDDCDGTVDEDSASDASTWYADSDSDGYGDAGSTDVSCDAPTGYLADNSDCDDGDAAIHPGATETCDGDDNDCDGSTDESSAVDASTWYQDRDEDGYGDPARTKVACDAPSGYLADNTDCDDLDAGANPGQDEICDDVDNDCDGAVDVSAVDASIWYADDDADGYGDLSDDTVACDRPTGSLADSTDCDDSDAGVNPGATEVCDGEDDNCDGSIDEDSAADAATWYTDADSDSWGDPDGATVACTGPTGSVSVAEDCDDADPAINPDADEVCDGADNDCDGLTDDASASDVGTWYSDGDGDSYGDPGDVTVSCTRPSGTVTDDSDCDDADAAINPDGVEVCDDVDNDCSGSVDDGAIDATDWYVDADSDTYGDKTDTPEAACDAPSGTVTNHTDCDDDCASCHPGGTEACDDHDNDCDGFTDEAGATGTTAYYPDDDGDGYGDETGTAVNRCDAPTGRVADNTDCDDTEIDINPGETETCDGTDNDCTGDEDGIVTFTPLTGTASDVSSTWASGSDGAATSITASTTGEYSVCPGTYYVSVTASATILVITGVYGSDETILSGGGSTRTIISTKTLTLEGLTLADGYTTTGSGGNLSSTSTLNLTDVVLERGGAKTGGNLFCSACTLTADTVDMTDGSATTGGNLYSTGGTLTLTTVTMSGGNATTGGGAYLASSTLTADTVSIDDSDATYGGCLYMTGSSSVGTLLDSAISTCNGSTSGGGVYLNGGASLTLTSSEISDNTAGSYGGGAYLDSSTLTIKTKSNIDGNSATLLGGGLYLTDTSSFSCTGSSGTTAGVWGNSAIYAGGAYMDTTDTITSTTCDWTASLDNDLYDVVVGLLLFYTKGNNATFTCNYLGC